MKRSEASERTRVLHVLPQDLNRGAQVYAGKLRDALRDDSEQEHLVVTIFGRPVGGARPDIELGVNAGRIRRLLDPRGVGRLRRLIRELDAAVIVAHGGEALKYVVAAARKRPTVYYKVGLSTAEIARPLHRRLYRLLSHRVSRVVGNSNAILDQVSEIFSVPKSRQALIPNGRDPQQYRPLADDEQLADPPRLLFVGQLEAGKRPSLFLDMVEEVRRKGYRCDAVVVGEGPLRSMLESRGREIGVRFVGGRSDVPSILRESAVLVMTSAPDTEGMPGILIEAGLSGIPAVATAAGGVDDVIRHGCTGYVVRDGQTSMLALKVGELLDDPDLRLQQGQAARLWCVEQFSIATTAEAWRKLVEELDGRSSDTGSLEVGAM